MSFALLGRRRARGERKGCLPAHNANPFSSLAEIGRTMPNEYPQESGAANRRRGEESERAGSVWRAPPNAQEALRLALALTQPKVIIYA